jgi:hypothetical protein
MSAKDKLINVFDRINQAYINCGLGAENKEISIFVDELRNGTFMQLSPDRQKSILDWYDEAYLGRGQLVKGMIFKKVLPPGFSSDMRIAIIMYLLELDIPDINKERLRIDLSKLITAIEYASKITNKSLGGRSYPWLQRNYGSEGKVGSC